MSTQRTVVTATRCQIERTVFRDFRGTNAAHFATTAGYYLCNVWFEKGGPRFQFRPNALAVKEHDNPLETASIVAIAIQMAVEWATDEMEAMNA